MQRACPRCSPQFFSVEDLNKGRDAALEEAQKVFAAAHHPDTGTNP
jgi:hypothetical protein